MPQALQYTEPLSAEVEEIIGDVPSWILRWGITMFFMLFVMLGSLTWLIRYPDLIKAPLTLSTTNAPAIITTKINGRLTQLFVKEGDIVQQNAPLAYIESTADHAQVLRLSETIERLSLSVSNGSLGNLSELYQQPFGHLGELQTAFQTFNQSYVSYAAVLSNGYYERKKEMIASELADMETLKYRLGEQNNLYQKDFDLATKEYSIHKSLAKQGVTTALEINREESKYLSKQQPIKQIEQSLVNLNTQRTRKQNEAVELNKQVFELRGGLSQSFLTLKSAVDAWKNNYVLTATTAGRVGFSQILQEKQMLAAGQDLLVIAPPQPDWIGIVRIPQLNFGKVKVGQRVLVKFNGYPSHEYGWVEGHIQSLAEVPAKDSSFLARVILPKGLETSYHKNLRHKNGMTATAEIVTEDLRLLERFFYHFRKLTSTVGG